MGRGYPSRVDLTVDAVEMPNVGLMVAGTGGRMVSLNAAVRKKLGKGISDTVTIRLTRRLTEVNPRRQPSSRG